MPVLDHTAVSLRVFGDDLKPDEVTALLGCSPSESWTKGDVKTLKSGAQFIRKTGAWFLRVPATEPEDFNGQISDLFSKATGDLKSWEALQAKYEVDLFCGWFMATSNDGVSVSVKTLRLLADRIVELSIDIYDSVEEQTEAQQGVQADVHEKP